MPEMYLRQPGFTYSVCGPFTKNKERVKRFEETGDAIYTYIYIYVFTDMTKY